MRFDSNVENAAESLTREAGRQEIFIPKARNTLIPRATTAHVCCSQSRETAASRPACTRYRIPSYSTDANHFHQLSGPLPPTFPTMGDRL